MAYPYAINVLTQFGKAAWHTAYMIDFSYSQPVELKGPDDMLAFSSGPLTPRALTRQFAERCEPVLALTADDMPTPEAAHALEELQSTLCVAAFPAMNLVQTEWDSLFPENVNVIENVLRLLQDERPVMTDLMTVNASMMGLQDLLLSHVEPQTNYLLQSLAAKLG